MVDLFLGGAAGKPLIPPPINPPSLPQGLVGTTPPVVGFDTAQPQTMTGVPPVTPELWQQWMMMQQMMMMRPPMPTTTPVAGFGTGQSLPSSPNLPQIPQPQLDKLLGPTPTDVSNWQWNRWYEGDRGDKDPIPRWDGKHPARSLKPWLRELRIWRQTTSEPVHRHGLKLARSFEKGTWLAQCADRIPEEQLVSPEAWGKILEQILVVETLLGCRTRRAH